MLTGRPRELDFLAGFFRQAAVSGGALLVSGDPGVGKTALLNAVADAASAAGTTVLRAAGVEFEGDISSARPSGVFHDRGQFWANSARFWPRS